MSADHDANENAGTNGDEPTWYRLHLWQIQPVRDVLLIGVLIALVWVGYALRSVTVPLLVALLLAYLVEPLVTWLTTRTRLTRPVVITGLLCTVTLVLLIVLALVIPVMVRQTTDLVQRFQAGEYHDRLVALAEYIPQEHRDRYIELLDFFDPRPQDESDDPATQEYGQDEEDEEAEPPVQREPFVAPFPAADFDWFGVARGGTMAVLGVIVFIIKVMLLAFLIPFYFFFFSMWYPSIVQFGREFVPDSDSGKTLELLAKMDLAVSGFVRGRIVISILMGIMFAIGWMICGVPYAVVLGLVVGVFCAVPYLGIIGIPLAVGLLALEQLGLPADEQMGWLHVVLWPTVVFVVVQAIESYAITPFIAGKATGLDPVTIIVVVIAGGIVMGIYGMLIAIPVAACGKILLTDVVLPKVRAWARGKARDPLPIES